MTDCSVLDKRLTGLCATVSARWHGMAWHGVRVSVIPTSYDLDVGVKAISALYREARYERHIPLFV